LRCARQQVVGITAASIRPSQAPRVVAKLVGTRFLVDMLMVMSFTMFLTRTI